MQCTIVAAKFQAVGNQTCLTKVLNASTLSLVLRQGHGICRMDHNPNGLTKSEPSRDLPPHGAALVERCSGHAGLLVWR